MSAFVPQVESGEHNEDGLSLKFKSVNETELEIVWQAWDQSLEENLRAEFKNSLWSIAHQTYLKPEASVRLASCLAVSD